MLLCNAGDIISNALIFIFLNHIMNVIQFKAAGIFLYLVQDIVQSIPIILGGDSVNALFEEFREPIKTSDTRFPAVVIKIIRVSQIDL